MSAKIIPIGPRLKPASCHLDPQIGRLAELFADAVYIETGERAGKEKGMQMALQLAARIQAASSNRPD